MTDPTTAVDQELTDEQIDVLRRYGSERDIEPGDVLFRPGDAAYDLIVVLEGRIDVVGGTVEQPVVVVSQTPRRFIGELGMITGQRAYMSAVVREAGRVLVVPNAEVRHVLDREGDVADLLLGAFIARRRVLCTNPAGAATIRVYDSQFSPGALALRGSSSAAASPS